MFYWTFWTFIRSITGEFRCYKQNITGCRIWMYVCEKTNLKINYEMSAEHENSSAFFCTYLTNFSIAR